ncbi:solute carrier family 22 member 6-A-like [Crotalus tigris]|uniref:solute carrier family 22 member 6-A-like n=1 Tax=Crotalus tigris TaxID=88082 RepID=UPI00192FAE17|nr:solute carrier family 22 member 6-A-like [Crotalus tigris]
MGFTEILEHVGSMGRFQIVYVTLISIPVLMMACHMMLQNFTAGTPDHHCATSLNAAPRNRSAEDEALLVVSLPMENGKPAKCHRFHQKEGWLLNGTMENETQMETEPCRDGWVYNQSVFHKTIVTEWNLVCSSRTLKQMAQSIYMAGVLVGGILFGGLSDRFGRRPILLWCYLQLATTGTATAFSPNFSIYCILRFVTGMSFSGIVMNGVSLCVEWTPTKTRPVLGALNGCAYTTGQLVLAGLAYLFRDWHHLQLVVSLPFFLFFCYSWWLCESARWLITAGKLDQAVTELKKVAKMNRKQGAAGTLNEEFLRSKMKEDLASMTSKTSLLDLVRTPTMRRISLCVCFVWFSTSFAYYGLVMDLQNFGGDIYLIQLFFGAVDFPAKFISVLTITYIGRRFTQAIALTLAGLTILANIFIPQDMQTLRTTVAVFGKGCLGASFNCIYLYTGELYPTVLRQTGMGLSNTMARIGGIVAPAVKMTGEYIPFLPNLIYGAAPIISGIVAAFLPETRNIPLLETIEQVENRSRNKSQKLDSQQTEGLLVCSKPEGKKITA